MSDRTGYRLLAELLRFALDEDAGCGSACAEDDGDICIDWGIGSRVVSVSISETGHVGWAALIYDWKDHGSCDGHISERVKDAIRRFVVAECHAVPK